MSGSSTEEGDMDFLWWMGVLGFRKEFSLVWLEDDGAMFSIKDWEKSSC